MNDITQGASAPAIFNFSDSINPIRVIVHDGDPWFIAKDVADALDYSWKGTATIGHIPEEWRGVYSVQTPSGVQELLTISEQGLYFFLGRSDKPKALPFQKWLAGEVLPSIRKTGRYVHPNAPQPHEAVEEYITPSQYYELKHLVLKISNLFHMQGAAANAIWKMLRMAFSAPNSAKIAITRLDDAKRLLAETDKACFAYRNKAVEAERRFFKSQFKALPSDLEGDDDDMQNMLPL